MAYVVDSTELQSFVQLFSNIHEELNYSIRTSDGAHFEYSKFDDVIGFHNSPLRQIDELSVEIPYSTRKETTDPETKIVRSEIYHPEPRAKITFRRPKYNGQATLEYSVSGDDPQAVSYYFDELENRGNGLRLSKPYSLIAFADIGMIVSIAVAGLSLTLLLAWSFSSVVNSSSSSAESSATTSFPFSVAFQAALILITVVIIWIVSIVLIGVIVGRIKTYLFPAVEFAIGAGTKRREQRQLWRNILFVVVLLGLIVSILGSFLFSRIIPSV